MMGAETDNVDRPAQAARSMARRRRRSWPAGDGRVRAVRCRRRGRRRLPPCESPSGLEIRPRPGLGARARNRVPAILLWPRQAAMQCYVFRVPHPCDVLMVVVPLPSARDVLRRRLLPAGARGPRNSCRRTVDMHRRPNSRKTPLKVSVKSAFRVAPCKRLAAGSRAGPTALPERFTIRGTGSLTFLA